MTEPDSDEESEEEPLATSESEEEENEEQESEGEDEANEEEKKRISGIWESMKKDADPKKASERVGIFSYRAAFSVILSMFVAICKPDTNLF